MIRSTMSCVVTEGPRCCRKSAVNWMRSALVRLMVHRLRGAQLEEVGVEGMVVVVGGGCEGSGRGYLGTGGAGAHGLWCC